MATWLGTTYFDTYANYELSYDLLGQNAQGNYSTVRLYGTLHVTGNGISWSSGSASVHTESGGIGTWYGRGDHLLIQRDFTFYHDNNGNFSSWIGGSISTTYKSGSTGGTMTLPKINRQAIVTGATDFNDEGNPKITFTNPAGFRINARLEFSGTYINRENIPNTGSYTFSLTNEERELLRSKIPNSNSLTVREVIATCYSGTTEGAWSYQDKTMTLINANPIFNNFEFEDINPTTLALTGDSSINVNGFSNIKVSIPTQDKAEAIKSATMSKYKFSIGTVSTEIVYSDSSIVSGVINNAPNGNFSVYAIDSRNNSTLVTKVASREIAYEPIYIDKQNSKIERDDNRVGDGAILTLNGTLWNNSFGVVTNDITSVTYRLKKTDSSTWIDGTTTITPTITDNSFAFSGLIASDNQDTTWDLNASYNVEVTISDELSTTVVEFILNSAIPTMCLDKNGVGIMCAYDSSLGGYLQVNGKVIESAKLLWTNPNPNNGFNPQDITLNSDDYDILEIYYYDWCGDNESYKDMLVQKAIKGYDFLLHSQITYNNKAYAGNRRVTYVNDTTLHFQNTHGIIDNSSFNTGLFVKWNVPLYVIGYKAGLF